METILSDEEYDALQLNHRKRHKMNYDSVQMSNSEPKEAAYKGILEAERESLKGSYKLNEARLMDIRNERERCQSIISECNALESAITYNNAGYMDAINVLEKAMEQRDNAQKDDSEPNEVPPSYTEAQAERNARFGR